MTIVRTVFGRVEGRDQQHRGRRVRRFLGIPYAQSPINALRFRAPVPSIQWTGMLDTTQFGPRCPQNVRVAPSTNSIQLPPATEVGCLNLNVWTPAADGAGRPVLVWIHGGGYERGSNANPVTDGSELAAEFDVVVVSINYRLGIFGFLDLPPVLGASFSDSANLGVLDMIAALEWVRLNIAEFGGDPSRVTLFGESAGGAAVSTLLGMPSAEGLFARAIVQSGSAERTHDEASAAETRADVLRAAGLTECTAGRLLSMDTAQLLEAQAQVMLGALQREIGLPHPFRPLVGDAVIPNAPLNEIRRGCNSTVDVIIGTNVNEASSLLGPQYPDDRRSAREKLEELSAIASKDDPGKRLDHYRSAYQDDLGRSPGSDDDVLESYLSDLLYRQPSNRLLDARAGAHGRTYGYLFAWESPVMGGALGAQHALDVPFVFRQLTAPGSVALAGDSAPETLADWMSGAWASFAASGVPAARGLPSWPEYGSAPGPRFTMIFDDAPHVASDPRSALRHFWRRESGFREEGVLEN